MHHKYHQTALFSVTFQAPHQSNGRCKILEWFRLVEFYYPIQVNTNMSTQRRRLKNTS